MRSWVVWHAASLNSFAFHQPSRMPTLESLTGATPKVLIQTPEEMQAVFATWREMAEK